MKFGGQSKFAIFVYKFLAFELAGQLILSILPTGWRDWFGTEFLLRGILWLGIYVLLLGSFIQIFRDFKLYRFSVFLPFVLLVVRVICIPLIFQFGLTLKFFVAENMYQEVANLIENSSIKTKKPQEGITLNFPDISEKYWYIGGGKLSRIQLLPDGKRNLIFFVEPSFDHECGFLYSSDNSYPTKILSFDQGEIDHFLEFKNITKNWFYGCVYFD